ncbi:hypothetical protein CIK05_00340 [Bdellovibrio sp. qaytius]|nr:hypothetical protein CIK05_00340 [Bdellovibrio sp. qaytius]
MRFKSKLSLFLMSAICVMSMNVAKAQEIPPSTENNSVDQKVADKKISVDYFLDFDWGEEVINLTPHPSNSPPNSFYEAATDTLVMGDYSKGFRVTKYSEFTAGVGLNWNFPNSTGLGSKAWLSVGIMPIIGKTTVSQQFQPTLDKALSANGRKIPMEASDLNSWAINDSVNYSSTGGIIFSVGVGFPGIGIGSDLVVQGTFSTYVERENADEVFVNISTTKAKSLSLQVDATLAQLSVSKYKEIEEAMSYMINFKDPVGYKAYHDLIRGNVAAIQLLLQDPNTTAIKKWEKLNRVQTRRMVQFNFGIPFIMNWGWSSGKIYEFSDTRAFYDDTRSEVEYGMYLKEKRKKIFGSMAVKTESFYGSVFRLYNYENDLMAKHIFGQYVFNADDNKTKTKDMDKTIDNLIEKTGLSGELALNIPSYKKLKFSRINLEVNFDEDQTINIMNSTSGMMPEMIAERANQLAVNFMANERQVVALCTPQETQVPMSTEKCLTNLKAQNARASQGLVNAAKLMKKYFDAGDDKAFVLAYADFGRYMLTNATMFQAIIAMGGAGVEMIYNVQNTYFQNYRVVYVTTDTPGMFQRKFIGSDPVWIFSNKDLNKTFNVAVGL